MLLLLRWRRQRHVRVENVGHCLPLSVGLLFPHFHQLAVVLLGLPPWIFRGDLISSHHVGQVARSCYIGFRYLPRNGSVRTEHGCPHRANRGLAGGNRRVGRQHGSVVGVIGNRTIQIVGHCGLSPL